jgi:glutamate 5-kinase
VGQIALAGLYAELFAAHGLAAAQLLLTADDLDDRRRHLNAAATLDRLLALGAVPVINENDSVATDEIRFGDNDRLAARVALAAQADALLLLSEIDGLYTADPARDAHARRIETVADPAQVKADTRGRSGMGTGGMAAKVEAARIATRGGIVTAIADGRPERPLVRFLTTGHGTVFTPARTARPRQAWLIGRQRVAGRLTVDAGAAGALREGASLLAAGVARVEGMFARGDVVDVLAPDGTHIARGIAAYDAAEVAAIAGTRSDAHAALLGYAPRAAVIHRDHMVLA